VNNSYNLKRLLLDIVYPNRCPFCGEIIEYDKYWHAECLEKLDFYGENCAVLEYNDKSKPFINAIKEDASGYAFAAAAKLIADLLSGFKFDLITCVPASKARLKLRGYNPPAMIARELAALLNVRADANLLVKTRETLIQKELGAAKRRENLKGAFAVAVNKRKIADTVLLIDDVRVTGSTLEEAAGTLVFAGAKQVYTAALAAVPTPSPRRS